MYQHLSFDLETLGVKERNTVIASVACVPFYLEELNTFDELLKRSIFIKINCKQQLDAGDAFSPDTLDWWSKQPVEVQEMSIKASPEDMNVGDAFRVLNAFIRDTKYDEKNSFVWSRGIAFDFPKIEYRFDEVGVMPINLFKARDVRTYFDTLTGLNTGYYTNDYIESEVKPKMKKHHALHDAVADAIAMQQIYNELFNTN